MIDSSLESHLKPIALRWRRDRLYRHLAWCWAGVAVVGAILLGIHRFTGIKVEPALPLLIVAGLIVASIIARRVGRTPLDFRALARKIEAEQPELSAVLLTAVEQTAATPAGELNYFQRRVVDEALEHYRRSPWGEKISRRLFAAQCAHWAALAVVVFVMAGLVQGDSRKPGIRAGIELPNGVSISPGDTNIERGSGLVVFARFGGKLPAAAELVLTPANESTRRVPLAKNLDDPIFGGGITEVRKPLTYHVEYSTGKTRDFNVGVFDYPNLDHADAKISYPAYTGLAEKTIKDTRRISAVEGSTVDYTFVLNKPVVKASLVAKDKSVLPLTRDTNSPGVYHTRLSLTENRRFALTLVDDAGRTNKIPPEFVLEALKSPKPELKLVLPHGDQHPSPLEEMTLAGEASGAFGLKAYGVAYNLAGGETRTVELGRDAKAREKRPIHFLLPLESLHAQPDQLVSYYLWADDLGPDGNLRRTESDMYFADIRPYDQIFREGQGGDQQGGDGNQGGGASTATQKLAEAQREITSATWNLLRRETAAKPSAQFKDDATAVRDAQETALKQLEEVKAESDARLKNLVNTADVAMRKSFSELGDAVAKNAVQPLSSALAREQEAGQGLLKLRNRQVEVARASKGQRGGGGGASGGQQELDEMDLKQKQDRYETQRQAASSKSGQQHEQVQVVNRLKELAQRQQDINNRLAELQTALQEAKTDPERDEIRDRLKRLHEEQQDMVADMDELRQRMDRPENQAQMADARQQLDQSRSDAERASEALKQNAVSDALTSGARAQRELHQLEQDTRKATSGQFADDMRKMRDDARQLADNEKKAAKKIEELAESRRNSLGDSDAQRAERAQLVEQLNQQKAGLTNLFQQMRDVSEQAETAEPLLSRQLYDLVRQTGQGDIDDALDKSAEMAGHGFLPQAAPHEERARKSINDLQGGVERAAESVLGDDTEALRTARRELEDLNRQMDDEIARNGRGTNTTDVAANAPGGAGERQPGGDAQKPADRPGGGKAGEPQANQKPGGAGKNPGTQPGQAQGGQPPGGRGAGGGREVAQGQQPGGRSDASAAGRNGRSGQPEARGGGNRNGDEVGGADGGGGAAGARGSGGGNGPLIGDDYVDWTDRLRDVEEMVDVPELSTEIARIRDRARAIRLDYKKLGKKPDWAVVKTQIAAPLAEVRTRVGEELLRRESKDALVPLDRDPVPTKFSEQVRLYYEKLGKSD